LFNQSEQQILKSTENLSVTNNSKEIFQDIKSDKQKESKFLLKLQEKEEISKFDEMRLKNMKREALLQKDIG